MPSQRRRNPITVFGETNFRNDHRRIGIKRADRRAHMYIIGNTGTGKSTLIANLAQQDVFVAKTQSRLKAKHYVT